MSDNPFTDTYRSAPNPFADTPSTQTNGNVAPAAGAWGSSGSHAWAGAVSEPVVTSSLNGYKVPAYVPPADIEVPAAMGSGTDRKKAEDLSRREAQLNQREAELKRMELEIRSTGGLSRKNWPKFCPIVHHDIAGEIPADKQGMVRKAYWAFLGLIAAMFFNWIATTAALIVSTSHLSSWLFAAIYMFAGIPLGYILWYTRLYNAAIKDSAIAYGFFFIFFLAHLVFCIWSAIGPPILNAWSHAGIMSSIEVIGDNTGVGIVYFIGAGLWVLESVWSIWTLKAVYSSFRGGGGSVTKIQSEAGRGAARSAV